MHSFLLIGQSNMAGHVDVGLICCADGGTEPDQWQPGEPLFDHAVYQAKLAMRSSQITGVLWHQGESDCCCHQRKYSCCGYPAQPNGIAISQQKARQLASLLIIMLISNR